MIQFLLPFHFSCVVLSLTLFIWRGARLWAGRPVTARMWQRTLPDSIDTLLLFSGIMLAMQLGFSPLNTDWLAAKLAAILLYIIVGAIALKFAQQRWLQRSCFITAIILFSYIVAVARSMSATPWS